MKAEDFIKNTLNNQFSPQYLEVVNESDGHNVAPGSETHFKVVLVTEAFNGVSAVKRHQTVYGALAEALQGGVHALALHTYSPLEWSEKEAAPASPNCMGGSK